jgi:single-strand DNA-binding protein
MSNYNKVILVGRLTRDPVTKSVGPDKVVTHFGLAVNRRWGDTEEVMFIEVGYWGKTGETIAKHFKKGKEILVEGHIKMSTWEDKDTKKERTQHTVVGERFEFVGGKSEAPSGEGSTF